MLHILDGDCVYKYGLSEVGSTVKKITGTLKNRPPQVGGAPLGSRDRLTSLTPLPSKKLKRVSGFMESHVAMFHKGSQQCDCNPLSEIPTAQKPKRPHHMQMLGPFEALCKKCDRAASIFEQNGKTMFGIKGHPECDADSPPEKPKRVIGAVRSYLGEISTAQKTKRDQICDCGIKMPEHTVGYHEAVTEAGGRL